MIYVVRFCGTQPSSIGAAVGQAIGVLDDYLQQLGHPKGRQLYVIYRNHIEGAVTVQVGYAVSNDAAASVTGEIFAATTPSGPMIELAGEPTLDRILAVGRSLPASSSSYTWQVYEEDEFRPWTGRLVKNLLVAAEFLPHLEQHMPGKGGHA
jgi:hypothetical protein